MADDGRGASKHAGSQMSDLVMLALAGSFFALTVGYCLACDRL